MDALSSTLPVPIAAVLALGLVLTVAALAFFFFSSKAKAVPAVPYVIAASKRLEAATANGTSSQKTIKILIGTQTGTAERFAKQLASELQKRYTSAFPIETKDLENYTDWSRLSDEHFIVFCVATYGDGEPTDSTAQFHKSLMSAAEDSENSLPDLNFAVFGLGNKQYEHFNAVGKDIFKALKGLQANPVVRIGLGDDDACIDDDFDKWCSDLFEVLDADSTIVGKKATKSLDIQEAAVPTYGFEILKDTTKEVLPFAAGDGTGNHSPFWATISVVKELHTSASDRSCVHVELDVQGAAAKYEHGDHVAIHPELPPAVVEELAGILGLPLETSFILTKSRLAINSSSLPDPFPGPLSLRTALAYMADVFATPHRDTLLALAQFAKNPTEAQRLRFLTSADGKAEFMEYVTKPHRSLLEVLRDFPSVQPSLGAFFGGITQRLQPRYYSISSSPQAHPTSIHVTCAVVCDTTPTGRVHDGVASSFLKRSALVVGRKVPVFVRHTRFKLPKDPHTPVIMVGPGTGLAPFRGFLQEREALVQSGVSVGPAHLFFGCRKRLQDFIYSAELEGFVTSGALSNLHVAFSRDAEGKEYVQHHIARQSRALWPLLDAQGAHLYVCGDAKQMAKDVQRTMVEVVQEGKSCSASEAEMYINEMATAARYQRDVW